MNKFNNMQIHELKSKTEKELNLKKSVAAESVIDKASGRGTKGQKARSGHENVS